MSQVEFEEDSFARPTPQFGMRAGQPASSMRASDGRGFAGWLVRHGIAKDESAARAILVGITIIDFVLMALVLGSLLFR